MEPILYEVIDDRIIKFASTFSEKYSGLDLIKRVYSYIKNEIYFDATSRSENASDALVLGYGNNKTKNELLYKVIKSFGFKCFVIESNIRNNSKLRFKRDTNQFKWYSVKIEFLDNEISLDVTFDKLYLVSAGIKDIAKFGEDQINEYILMRDNIKLFKVNSVNVIKEDEKYMMTNLSYIF